MTISVFATVLSLIGLMVCAIRYLMRKADPPVWISMLDTEEEEDELQYALTKSILSDRETEVAFLCAACLAVLTFSLEVLVAINCAILVVSSASDFKSHSIPVLYLLTLFITSCAIGARNGQVVPVILCVIVFCVYEVKVTDSDSFGGGDVYALLACFSLLGFFMGCIATIISCIVGIIMKSVLWITKIDDKENRGIPFVPAISVGTIAGYILKIRFADILSVFNMQDIIWFIAHR